jgi:hypothetical protein
MNLPISKAMAIHIGCEVLLVGTISILLSRRISSTQSDLAECALRIVTQGKQIAELEERLAEMEEMVKRLAARPMAAAPQPQPFPFPLTPFQSFPVPVPSGPAPSSAKAAVEPDKPAPSSPAAPSAAPAAVEQSDDLDKEIAGELAELTTSS